MASCDLKQQRSFSLTEHDALCCTHPEPHGRHSAGHDLNGSPAERPPCGTFSRQPNAIGPSSAQRCNQPPGARNVGTLLSTSLTSSRHAVVQLPPVNLRETRHLPFQNFVAGVKASACIEHSHESSRYAKNAVFTSLKKSARSGFRDASACKPMQMGNAKQEFHKRRDEHRWKPEDVKNGLQHLKKAQRLQIAMCAASPPAVRPHINSIGRKTGKHSQAMNEKPLRDVSTTRDQATAEDNTCVVPGEASTGSRCGVRAGPLPSQHGKTFQSVPAGQRQQQGADKACTAPEIDFSHCVAADGLAAHCTGSVRSNRRRRSTDKTEERWTSTEHVEQNVRAESEYVRRHVHQIPTEANMWNVNINRSKMRNAHAHVGEAAAVGKLLNTALCEEHGETMCTRQCRVSHGAEGRTDCGEDAQSRVAWSKEMKPKSQRAKHTASVFPQSPSRERVKSSLSLEAAASKTAAGHTTPSKDIDSRYASEEGGSKAGENFPGRKTEIYEKRTGLTSFRFSNEPSTVFQLRSACVAFLSKYTGGPKTYDCLKDALKEIDNYLVRNYPTGECAAGLAHTSLEYDETTECPTGNTLTTCDSLNPDHTSAERNSYIADAQLPPVQRLTSESRLLFMTQYESCQSSLRRKAGSVQQCANLPPSCLARKHDEHTSLMNEMHKSSSEIPANNHARSNSRTPFARRIFTSAAPLELPSAVGQEDSEEHTSHTKNNRPVCTEALQGWRSAHVRPSAKGAAELDIVKVAVAETWAASVPPLHPALQHLSYQFTGKHDNAELRCLTQIQQCVLIHIAQVASRESAEAKERLLTQLKTANIHVHVEEAKLRKTEQHILRHIPLVLPLDVYSGACPSVLEGNYRVRVSVALAPNAVKPKEERLGTLSEMWHILEMLAPDDLKAVIVVSFAHGTIKVVNRLCPNEELTTFYAVTNDLTYPEAPSQSRPFLEFHVHGRLEMGKDIEAIAVRKVVYEMRDLSRQFVHHLSVKYLLPVFTIEEFSNLIKDPDLWSTAIRERTHALTHATASLGNTSSYV